MKSWAVAVLSLSLSATLPAQEAVSLDTATINRLGLVFAAVVRADAGSGTRLPATVIASPQSMSGLRARHEGILESWQVSIGQLVSTGTVLAELQSPALLELQQQWMAANTADQQAALVLARDSTLFAEGIIARQRLQESERTAQQAQFTLLALTSALEQSGYDSQDLSALQNGEGLGLYRIRAAFDGVVTSLPHRAGDLVGAGETVLALSGGTLWASAELPARLAERVQPGQTLTLADRTVTLQVRQLEQAYDETTQTAELLASFDNPAGLKPGQVVTLMLPPQAEGVVVPATAVVHNGAETVVYVRTAAGVEARTLALQPAGADYLTTVGLAAGELVVVRGAALLKGVTLGLGGE